MDLTSGSGRHRSRFGFAIGLSVGRPAPSFHVIRKLDKSCSIGGAAVGWAEAEQRCASGSEVELRDPGELKSDHERTNNTDGIAIEMATVLS
jgi:hypothetical protein